MSLQFQVSGWTDDDLILIKDSQHEERYEGEMLYRQHVYETSDNIELFFYRETNNTKNEPTVVTLKWDESGTGERCEEETVKKVTARQSSNEILVSPGYPRNYADAQICQYSITAEDYDRGFHISIGAKFDPKLTPPSNIYWKELIGAVGLVLIISILVAGVYTYKQGYWDRWLKKEQTNNGNVERLITTQSDPANGNGNGLTDINPSISRFDSVFN
uniref:CUB domain-containing protein n=1 Tax=Caenorhabditis japonica TaxID=281687 RepID=A0A8R1HGI7_CAEJA